MSNKKAIVLLSGGLDSAVTLYFAKSKGYKCHCLVFDYYQRHRRELVSAKAIARRAGCLFTVERINLFKSGSALLDRNIHVPHPKRVNTYTSKHIPVTYVPGRNIIFLSFALSFAESIGANAIFIGAHTEDYSGYPDCRPQFYRAFRKVVACGTKSGIEGKMIEIATPLINKSKVQIIRLGRKLKVPLDLTWSCYEGGKYPCGKCESCYFRIKGFKEAGLVDKAYVKR